VRVAAAQEGRVQHVRQHEVGQVAALAAQERGILDPRGTLPQAAGGRADAVERAHCAPRSRSTAARAAATMFW
jgi:hypothetical protein